MEMIEQNKSIYHELQDLEVSLSTIQRALEPLSKKDPEKLEEGYKFVLESLQQCMNSLKVSNHCWEFSNFSRPNSKKKKQTLDALNQVKQKRKGFPFK